MKTEFEISKHPLAQGFDRKVTLLGPFVNFAQKQVVCHVELKHYKNGVESDDYIKPSNIKLYTDNNKFVDANGQRVEKDENGLLPENAIPEFDFLFNYVSQVPNQTLGNMILEVIEFMIQRNDQNGNFNDLRNFDS